MSHPSPPDPGPPRRRTLVVATVAGAVLVGVATVVVATVLGSRPSDEPSGAPDEADRGGAGACPPDPTVTVESSTVAPLSDPNPAGFFTVQVSGTIVNNSGTPVTASVEVPMTPRGYAPLRSESIEVGSDATAPFVAAGTFGLLPGTTTFEPDRGAADLAWLFVDADLAHCSRQHGDTG